MQGNAMVKLNLNARATHSLVFWQTWACLVWEAWLQKEGNSLKYEVRFSPPLSMARRMCWCCCVSGYFSWRSGKTDQVFRVWQGDAMQMKKKIIVNRKNMVCKSHHFRFRRDFGVPRMSELGRWARTLVQLGEGWHPAQGHLGLALGPWTLSEYSLFCILWLMQQRGWVVPYCLFLWELFKGVNHCVVILLGGQEI